MAQREIQKLKDTILKEYPRLKKDDKFEVSVGKNPWKRFKPIFSLGYLCASLGGGGRENAGGITLDSYEDACKVSARVINFLQNPLPQKTIEFHQS